MTNRGNPTVEKSFRTAINAMKLIALAVVVAILFSGVTFIRADEVALIIRFGRLVGDTPAEQIHQPGLKFAFPYLIDEVIRVPVQRIQEVPIEALHNEGELGGAIDSGYAITGDENIVLIKAVLQYQVTDPVEYALRVNDPETILKDQATTSLIHKISGWQVDSILTYERRELAVAVLQDAQARVDEIGLGVQLVALEFSQLRPPHEVRDEFDLVTSTYLRKETMLQEAQRYREEQIPAAVAGRDERILQAESYKRSRIAQAQSDVARFESLVDEYSINPVITRERVYRRSVENIMKNVGDTVLLPPGKQVERIILP